jgi:hypothetical protein
MQEQTTIEKKSESVPETLPETSNKNATPGAEPSTPAVMEDKEPVRLFKVPNVFKTRLAHISGIEAKDGFLTVYTNDGKVHRKTAEDARDMAKECATMLEHMARSEMRGIPVPPHIKKQTQELISMLVGAFRKAKYQQETALKMDHATRAVGRMTDNLAWQKGQRPERGEFNTDFLPEDNNIQHLMSRFPMLKDYEIAGILRATQVSYGMRMQILMAMNGKRMMEENRITAQDVMKMVGGDVKLEMPAGVGIKKPVELEKPIKVQAAKVEPAGDSKAD